MLKDYQMNGLRYLWCRLFKHNLIRKRRVEKSNTVAWTSIIEEKSVCRRCGHEQDYWKKEVPYEDRHVKI